MIHHSVSFNLLILLCLGSVWVSCTSEQNPAQLSSSLVVEDYSGTPVPEEYLVRFSAEFMPSEALSQEDQARMMIMGTSPEDCELLGVFQIGHINGMHLRAVPSVIAQLSRDKRITLIEPNRELFLSIQPSMEGVRVSPFSRLATEVVSPRITTAGGPVNMIHSHKRAWILDSGIDRHHPDLVVDTVLSRNFIGPAGSYDDDWGHGTHIAGIIGAKANDTGVVGWAAGIPIVAVRVLNNEGRGDLSTLLQALQYLYQQVQTGDVVHLSPGPLESPLLQAILTTLGSDKQVFVSMPVDGHLSKSLNMHVLSTFKANQYLALSGAAIEAAHLAGSQLNQSLLPGLPSPTAPREPSFTLVRN